MNNPTFAKIIAELRANPDPINRNRNRMLASMLEVVNNEGPKAFVSHTNDILACIVLTFGHLNMSIEQVADFINHRLAKYQSIIDKRDIQ